MTDALDEDAIRRVLFAFAVNDREAMTSGDLMAASGLARAPDVFTKATDMLVARDWLRRGHTIQSGWRMPIFSITHYAWMPVDDAAAIRRNLRVRDRNLPTQLLLLPPLEELLVA